MSETEQDRGVFIVFEGGEGAGKSTQAERLAAWLTRTGQREVVLTREPGGTVLGEQIRTLLLHGDDMSARTEALLFAADRAEHVDRVIRPALRRGAVVISDRYVDSSVAYQVQGRGLTESQVRAVNDFATAGLRPDVTILLDIGPAAAATRLTGEPDRIEQVSRDFHERVNAHYRAMAGAEPDRYIVIDATLTVDEVFSQVRKVAADICEMPAGHDD